MLYELWFKAMICGLCAPIFIGGYIGNILVIAVVLKNKRMRTVTNIFISQLAVGDLIILTFCMPFTVTSIYITETWLFGETLCKVVMFMQVFSVMVSVLTLTAMSLERYLVIMHPLTARARWTPSSAVKVCVALVLVSAGLSLPRPMLGGMLYYSEGLSWGVSPPNASQAVNSSLPILYCFEDLPNNFVVIYNGVRIGLFYVVPLLLMGFMYFRLCCVLRKDDDVIAGPAGDLRRDRNAKVTRLLVAMVIVFGVCWLPYQLFLVVQMWEDGREVFKQEWFQKAMVFVSALMYFNCISNPILYTFLSAQYRKGFKKLLCCCLPQKSNSLSSSRKGTISSSMKGQHAVHHNIGSTRTPCDTPNSTPVVGGRKLNHGDDVSVSIETAKQSASADDRQGNHVQQGVGRDATCGSIIKNVPDKDAKDIEGSTPSSV